MKQTLQFSSQYPDKSLSNRMMRIKQQWPDTDEDGSTSSPAKLRVSSDKLTVDTVLNVEEGSSGEENGGHQTPVLGMFSRHLNHSRNQSVSFAMRRLQGPSLLDQEGISTGRSQVLSSTNDMWAKKLMPIVEQKLCNDMLSHNVSQKSTPSSSKKRNKKRGFLGVMDDAIRAAVDSDSALSNFSSPRVLPSGADNSSGIKKKEGYQLKLEGAEHEPMAEGLEAKFMTLQDLVGELRRCMEGFTVRVEAEGERWQNEMQGLEKKICTWKESAECEMVGMKKTLADEMQKMMDDVRVGLIRLERLLEDVESSKQDSKLEQESKADSTFNMESMQRKMESLIADMKVDILCELKEKVTSGIRRDLDGFELEVSKQFESMHRDMESTLAEMKKIKKLDKQEIEALIEEKLDKRLPQHMEIISEDNEKAISDMRNDLHLLWTEVDMLSKDREEIKDTMEQLSIVAEEAKQSSSEEHNLIKHENELLKKQLHYLKKESMQVKAYNEGLKKDIGQEMEHIRSTLQRIKEEEESTKVVLQKVLDGRKNTEDCNECPDERMIIMKEVEGLAQVYLRGLEDVRNEFLNFKLECHERMEELEGNHAEMRKFQEGQEKRNTMDSQLPLKDFVFSGLESRVSHIESRLDQISSVEADKIKTLAALEKDRVQASAALDHVTSTAQKADEFVAEMLKRFSSELTTVMRQSRKIQENISAEKNLAAASASEINRISELMDREMQVAMAVMSEAQTKGIQIKESLEKDISVLKGSIVLEKEAASAAAASTMDVVTKAEAALADICRMQKESFAISENLAKSADNAYMTYTKDLANQFENWKKMLNSEVIQARSLVEGIQREQQIIQSVGEEKRRAQDEFEEYVKKTEDALRTLSGNMKELNASVDSQNAIKAETEKKEIALRDELKDLREKVNEAFTRLEAASEHNMKLDNNLSLHSQTIEELLQAMKNKMNETVPSQVEIDMIVKNLESKMSEIISFQTETADKVNNCCKKICELESAQQSTLSSLEQVQGSTGDLQKSAAAWLQKYEVAARLLQGLEKRILTMEERSNSGGSRDDQLDTTDFSKDMEPAQKERLMNLYSELSGFIQRLKINKGVEDNGNDAAGWSHLNARVVTLENKVSHVETEAFSNMRLLDAKMEGFSISVETALEGASMAESKCSALGAELIKLFRMIGINQQESPSKKMMMMMEVTEGADELNNEYQQSRSPMMVHTAATDAKGQPSCNYCKKPSTKSNSGDFKEYGYHDSSCISEGYKMGDMEHKRFTGLDKNLKMSSTHGKRSPQHHSPSREASPTFKIKTHQFQKDKEEPTNLETAWKRGASEGRLPEGKLPITTNERRMEASKKLEGIQISGKPELQLTNIKLEAGKVQVNVGHRPLTATRSKRGDAFADAPS
ncbi:hypothetical protein KP509_06G020600 [Ceratopteris richardii]|nr:hypothetical protein KP509_06G020600 [Ceratopteris richardii]